MTEYVPAAAMSASPSPGQPRADLQIQIGLQSDADPAELDEATRRLRSRLLELDVDRVERPTAGEAPPGARAAELIELGGLVVSLARNFGTVASVIVALQSWLARDRGRSIRLELDGDALELSGISSDEQERLIAAFISRHAAK